MDSHKNYLDEYHFREQLGVHFRPFSKGLQCSLQLGLCDLAPFHQFGK